MQYQIQSELIFNQTQCLWLATYQNQQLSPTAEKLDQQLNGQIRQLIEMGDIKGNIGEVVWLRHQQQRILLIGCGEQGKLNERQFKQIIGQAMQASKTCSATCVYNALTDVKINGRDLDWNIRFSIESIEGQNYQFDQFKQKKAEPSPLQEIIFQVESSQSTLAQQAIEQGKAVAFGVRCAKDVANLPPNVCNPSYLAELAKTMPKNTALLTTQIIDEKQMAELGMNAYLAVSRGSANEAKLSIMHYNNAPERKPIVLVGKGLTFDAGGISLKPAAEMDEMKYDMGGAAAVYGVMNALVQLQLPLNVIGVLAGCENLPDGDAYRPGDILTAMNGLTVEVLNTDAEGRLVLADTLTYVERFEPELVIDIATLTGACVVALGQHNSGLISENDQLVAQLEQAAHQANDKVWRLPLSEEYSEQLKSNFADLANIGGRWGGASTAGAFLSHFTKNYPWAHLDIAGTAWLQGTNKGATGRPVPMLVQFLIEKAQQSA